MDESMTCTGIWPLNICPGDFDLLGWKQLAGSMGRKEVALESIRVLVAFCSMTNTAWEDAALRK